MRHWLRVIRGVIGTGLTWAIGWGLTGLLIGVSSILLPGLPWDAFFRIFDAPLPALAVPGFLGGVLFSTVLRIAGRRSRFDQLSLPRFAAWGALGGLVLGLLPVTLVTGGLGTAAEGAVLWQFTAIIVPPLMLLSAVSASGSLMLARKAEDRALLEAGEDGDELLTATSAGDAP